MSDGKDDDNTPWTHQPYGGSAEQPQPPQPPAYPTNPYADPQQAQQHPQQGQPQWGQQPYQAPQQGYGQPYAQGYPQQFQPFPVVPNHPSANTALILGIVALGGGLVLCGLPLVVGPFAWAVGARATREIDADPQRYGGRSEANTGKILGIISTVLLALGVLAIVAVIAIGVATSSTSSY